MNFARKSAAKSSLPTRDNFSVSSLGYLFVFTFLVYGILFSPLSAHAAITSITPVTWNVIGLDSNRPSTGPDRFPVGARVCSNSSTPVTQTVTFHWTSSNSFIDLASRSPYPNDELEIDIPANGCADAYFEVIVQRDSAAYDTRRGYYIEAGGLTTPQPRELYVEHLVSQARNGIVNLEFGKTIDTLTSVPAGGSFSLVKGETYFIRMTSYTAPGGYEQLETFSTLPTTIFQVHSVVTTYTADTSTNVSSPLDMLYGDACYWEEDPNSPNYLACNGDGKVGGNMTVTYEVEIIDLSATSNPINSLVYDLSGASFHYNSDYDSGGRSFYIVDPAAARIDKSFYPDPTNVGGTSTLTFTLTNPGGGPLTGANFTDTFPTSPGAMVVASPAGATTSNCGTPTFSPTAGATSISFSGGTIPANGSCTVKVNVTVPTAGTYTNTSNNLFIGTIDTGDNATDTLVADTTTFPPPSVPTACNSPTPLATWSFDSLTSGVINNGTFNPDSLGANVTSALASYGAKSDSYSAIVTNTSYPDPPWTKTLTPPAQTPDNNSWGINGGWPTSGAPTGTTVPYFQFQASTTSYGGLSLISNYNLRGNWSNAGNWYVLSSTDGGTWSQAGTAGWSKADAWQDNLPLANATDTGVNPTTYFRVIFSGSQYANNATTATAHLDDVVIRGCARPLPPTITKVFSPNPVAVGGSSVLTFTITNPNTDTHSNYNYSGLTFTDPFPAGLTYTSTTSNSCGGTLQDADGNSLAANDVGIKLSAGTLNSNSSCTIVVNVAVASDSPGPHANVTSFISATQSGANTGATGSAAANLIAVLPPSIDKLFAPNPILTGGKSTLTFTLINPNPDNALSGITFTDTFPTSPAAMVVATSLVTSNTCGGSLLDNGGGVLASGDPGIRLTGGTIAAGGSCTVSVEITAPTAGSYANTSGTVSHTLNGTWNGNTATDTLTVNTASPGIALVKEVGASATGPWYSFLATSPGATIYYHYTVENYGDVALSSVGVTDNDVLVSTAACSWASVPAPVSGNNNHIVECTSTGFAAQTGAWSYVATVTGTYVTTPTNIIVTDTSSARYATVSLSLVKSATEPNYRAAAEIVHYNFIVTNSGYAALAGPVTLLDDKTTDESCPAVNTIGDFDNYFDPGEALTCTATYTVAAGDITSKSITNTAHASISGFSSADATKILYLAPDLSVVKSNNVSGKVNLSQSFVWTLTVTNAASAGTATFLVNQVLLQDDLPNSGASYSVPATATKSAGATGTIACSITTSTLSCTASDGSVIIPPGETFSIAVTVTVSETDPLVNPRNSGLCQVDPTPQIREIDETNNSCSDTVTVPMPSLLVLKSVDTYSDPINNTTSPKPIPGAFMVYTIQVINSGPGAVDNNTTVITDPIPANTELFTGDIDGGGPSTGPILFIDGTTASGLSYTFTSLSSTTDNLAFSDNNALDYNKSDTVIDSNECDPSVTNIKIPLSGIFIGSDGVNHPSFSVKFRVRIK